MSGSEKRNGSMKSLLSQDFFSEIEKECFNRSLYPSFKDRSLWEKAALNEPLVGEILAMADEIGEGQIPSLPFSRYCEYARNGNRVNYEQPYFLRRRQLQLLVLGMCFSGDREKYMTRILERIIAILEEWTWTVPAHIFWTEQKLPDLTFSMSDLFANETGAVLAYCVMLIGDELEAVAPGLVFRIRTQTLQRTFYNIEAYPDRHWWFMDKNPQNWSIWCSLNNLLVIILLEQDREKMRKGFEMFLDVIFRYGDNYDDNGFCAEGPMYYTKSGLMFACAVNVLNKFIPGSMDKLLKDAKVRSIFSFIAKVRVAGPYAATFGDARPMIRSLMGAILAAGKAIGSDEMLALERYRVRSFSSFALTGDLFTELLSLFFDVQCSSMEFPVLKEEKLSFFPDHLGVIRTDGFSAFIKAGNNGEPHNHNDLGHFGFYCKDIPVIVDAGTEAYTKKNFGPERYTLWYTRGSGHNAPVINGTEQCFGKEYTASLVREGEDAFLCDLSAAYMEGAGIVSFKRTMTVQEKVLTIQDVFAREQGSAADSEITLLTPLEVTVQENGSLLLGDRVLLTGEGIQFVSTETMPPMNSRENENSWGTLKALHFRSTADQYRFVFTAKD